MNQKWLSKWYVSAGVYRSLTSCMMGPTVYFNLASMAPCIIINELQCFYSIQMENISNFLAVTQSLGVNKIDLFQTVDLYEAQNIPLVIYFQILHFLNLNTINDVHKRGEEMGVTNLSPNILNSLSIMQCNKVISTKIA